MPVHRAPGSVGGRVFAYTDELSAWLISPANDDSAAVPAVAVPHGVASTSIAAATGQDRNPLTSAAVGTATVVPIKGRASHADPATHAVAGQPLPASAAATSRAPGPWFWANALWPITVRTAVVVLALAVVGLAWMLRGPDSHSVAVLPFVNDGAVESNYLSDGIAESLIDNLSTLPKLKVRSWGAVSRYRVRGAEALDVPKTGAELAVSYLVSGQVLVHDDDVDVHATLTDARDDVEVWGQRYSGRRADLVTLQQRIAGDLADQLRLKLSPAQREQAIRQGTLDPQAYQLFLQGRYAWNQRTRADLDAAIGYFTAAIAKDPNYAQAYSGLADVYCSAAQLLGQSERRFCEIQCRGAPGTGTCTRDGPSPCGAR